MKFSFYCENIEGTMKTKTNGSILTTIDVGICKIRYEPLDILIFTNAFLSYMLMRSGLYFFYIFYNS